MGGDWNILCQDFQKMCCQKCLCRKKRKHLKIKILSSLNPHFNCSVHALFHSEWSAIQQHTHSFKFSSYRCFSKHVATDSENTEETVTESAFSLFAFLLYSLFLFQTVARIYRSLSQKTGISKSFSPLAFSSPAIIQNNKTLDDFFGKKQELYIK